MIYGLYEHHSLVGFGFFGVGYGTPGPLRNWYTHATGKPLKVIMFLIQLLLNIIIVLDTK